MKLSKEICIKFFNFIERGLKVPEFERWVYECDTLSKELDINDYLTLIELDYYDDNIYYKMDKILYEFLDKYVIFKNDVIKQNGIVGKCISNIGRYNGFDNDNTFQITEGKEYIILGIDIKHNLSEKMYMQYIIMDDESSVYYVPSSVLKIEHIKLPNNWIIEEDKSFVSLEPKDFNMKYYKGRYSFWEDFHDDIEGALIVFTKYLLNHEV